MTIDESIKYLKALKRCETCETGDIGVCKSCSCYRIGSSAKCYDAIDVGVDTMQKYQKIREIVTQWQNETNPKIKFARSNIEKIKEVLEDGKID